MLFVFLIPSLICITNSTLVLVFISNTFTLSLQQAKLADSGSFRLTAENNAGSCTVVVDLLVAKGDLQSPRYMSHKILLNTT